MVIFISGASGYLGSHLVKAFSRKHQVFALIRRSSSKERINNIKSDVIYVDSSSELNRAFSLYQPEIVINTAALYGRNGESLSEMVSANINFPTQLLELSHKHNSKVFINTGTSLPDDVSPYALTKNTFSQLAKFNSKGSLKFINVALEHFYGPKDGREKFISHVIDRCLSGQALALTEGTQERDFIYISDVVEAYRILVGSLDKLKSFETISVGSGVASTIRELVEVIHTYSHSNSKLEFGSVAMRDNELMYSCADISRLKELGWIKKYDFIDGVREVLNDI